MNIKILFSGFFILTMASLLFSEIKPDFVGFQEIDFNSKRSYFINQLDTIAEEKEYGYSAYSINWDKNYVPFPYWPLSVQFGKMLSGQAGAVYDLYNRYAEDFSDEKTMEIFFKGSNIKEAIPFEVYKENEAATFTYPSEQPNRRLDYIFYNPSEIKPLIGYVSSLAGTASDHLPVVFQFSFRN